MIEDLKARIERSKSLIAKYPSLIEKFKDEPETVKGFKEQLELEEANLVGLEILLVEWEAAYKNPKYVSEHLHSDVHAYEVVKQISDKTIEIRQMKVERDESVKLKFHAGGFAGHCSNQREQKWFYESNPEAEVIRVRRSKHDARIWVKGNRKFYIHLEPYEFYDYNY